MKGVPVKIQVLLSIVAVAAVTACSVPGSKAGVATSEGHKTYDLRFRPSAERELVVAYTRDMKWDNSGSMHGVLHTELELHWRFSRGEKGPEAQAAFASIVYRGEGVKNDEEWKHDVLWKREPGYLKGMDSSAAKTWIDKELKEGVTFVIDQRGAVQPGSC